MKRSALLPALLASTIIQAQPVWQAPPRLVVGIVVDQMRTDMLYREWDNFGADGFKRLLREGSFQRDAHYGYVPTYTAPGHSSIYSGTTPSRHGITSNYIYDRTLRRSVYCLKDTSMRGIGTNDPSAKRSPAKLLASTLADEMELRWGGRSKTIGIALKDRSAMLPIGRTGDAAYWFQGGTEGRFVTSSWYRDELPPWVVAFNEEGKAAAYLERTWELALPRDRYHTPVPDDDQYEWPLVAGLKPTLPVDLAALRRAGTSLDLIKSTPWGNTITTDMALAAITGEALGQDSVPDLLALSYSSPDESAHDVGQRAIELEDIYIRLDAELARLFAALDERIGAGNYTVFLTADHGGADVPAYLQDQQGSAGYAGPAELMGFLRSRGATAVDTIVKEHVFLKPGSSNAAADSVAEALMQHPKVATAESAHRLVHGSFIDPLKQAMTRGWMHGRSGDVVFALRPGYMVWPDSAPHKGTDHGTAWNYDTAVPVVLMGRGILPGEVLRRTDITDIAPTICAILGVALPNAADGRIVPEAIRPTVIGR